MKIRTDSCRVAIVTRYLPPTNYKGARVVATVNGYRVVADYNHDESGHAAHVPAVEKLIGVLGWDKYYPEAELFASAIDGGRYAWSFAPRA